MKKDDIIKIKGHDGLVRDPKTRAVINTDSNALERAKRAKQNRMQYDKRMTALENKMDHILDMLTNLKDNDNGND